MVEQLRLRWQKATDGYRHQRLGKRDSSNDALVVGRQLGPFALETDNDGVLLTTDAIIRESDFLNETIVARNRRLTTLALDASSTVVFDLANMPPTVEGVLRFANKWGLLEHSEPPGEAAFAEFYCSSTELWSYLDLMNDNEWSRLHHVIQGRSINAGMMCFATNRGATLTYQEPRNLSEFCFLQLKALIEQRAAILRCSRCDGFYTRKRNTRRACSEACKNAIYKRRRRMHRRGSSDGAVDAPSGLSDPVFSALVTMGMRIFVDPNAKQTCVKKTSKLDDGEFARLYRAWCQRGFILLRSD